MAHEDLKRDETEKGSNDRSFGFVFAAVFAMVAVLPWLFGGPFRLWAMVASVGFLAVGLVAPALLAPLNRLWFKFGLLLHKIVSPLVLGIMFFLVITPTGLLMRALGKDPLRLKLDKRLSSYWIERMPPGPTPESLKDQF